MTCVGVDACNLATDQRGMGRLVRQTLESLEQLGAEIALIVRSDADATSLRASLPYRTIRTRQIARERFDVLWYPWNGMRFAPHGPCIVTIHDPFAFTFPRRDLVGRLREQLPIRRALARADRIFTVSAWTREELRRLFDLDPRRIAVVPNAPNSFWHPIQRSAAEPFMLFLAGPEPRKNASMLFHAYDEAFAHGGPPLLIGGTLGQADARELQRMRAPHRRVHPADEELRELYCSALAVLVPSLAEGYGLPVVEAMACGAPVAASDAAALPETCGGAALLLPPQDAPAWSAALRTLHADARLRDDLRTRGLQRTTALDRDGPAKALLQAARDAAANVARP